MSVRITLYIIAALLLGAHFYRAGSYLVVALCLTTPLLFLLRKRWGLILLQLAAYGAAAVWLWAAFAFVAMRQQGGRPWATASVILGAVALFTLVAALLLNSRCMQERYPHR
jgi:hypothetical protein